MRRRAISAYLAFSSIPTKLRLSLEATSPVVPAPANGSRTVSPMAEPARMQGSTRAGGNVAKWASGKGAVAMVQTERLLRSIASSPLIPASSGDLLDEFRKLLL